ncbi:MAG: alkaline phosphatase D family protein [Solirubrobacterales bacterium]
MAATTRRGFVTSAAAVPTICAIDPFRLIDGRALAQSNGASFAQGVASGQATCGGITLWTRLDGLEASTRLSLEVARDPGFGKVVFADEPIAEAGRDFTVHTRLAGLDPGEQYFYRFSTAENDSQVGRFRTSYPADSCQPVRVGFFSCQNYVEGFYTAHAGLAREDLDLVVCLGDYVYERTFGGMEVRQDPTGADGVSEVETLPEYRAKYNLYHSDADLRAVRANHAMMAIWDDHEVEDNYAADEPGEATEQRDIPFGDRRRNGYQAFFEHMPRIKSGGDADRIYGSLRLGGTAELFLLDQRQYRDDQPCGDMLGSANCPEAFEEGRTLLGQAQKEWLKAGLADSEARWKLVGNQVMIMSLDLPAGNPLNPDQWDGYKAEREELIDHVNAEGITDVAFLTGDIHTFFAGQVTPSGRQPSQPQPGPAAATEFVGGSITSLGVADRVSSDPRERAILADLSDSSVRANNPHIVYSNQEVKGYGILEASEGELLVSYRNPQTVLQPQSTVQTLQRFRVESGTPEVETLGPPLGGTPN